MARPSTLLAVLTLGACSDPSDSRDRAADSVETGGADTGTAATTLTTGEAAAKVCGACFPITDYSVPLYGAILNGDLLGRGYPTLVATGRDSGGSTDSDWVFLIPPDVGLLEAATNVRVEVPLANGSTTLPAPVPAGDVDGDGFEDLIVATTLATDLHIFRGPVADQSSIIASDVRITDVDSSLWSQNVVATADFTGDGAIDIVLRPTDAERPLGGDLVGMLQDFGTQETRSAWDAQPVLTGPDVGGVIASAGDTNGDGYQDLIVTSISTTNPSGTEGVVHWIAGPLTERTDLSEAEATIYSTEGNLGVGQIPYSSISGAGDTNGDSHDDLMIGVHFMDAPMFDAGVVYLVLGPVSGVLDGDDADARLYGTFYAQNAGDTLAAAGDVNGDSFADILVGSPMHDCVEGWPCTGEGSTRAFLLNGPIVGEMELGQSGTVFLGESEVDRFSSRITSAPDGNGRSYILISQFNASAFLYSL